MSNSKGTPDNSTMLNALAKPTATVRDVAETGDTRVFHEPTLAGLAIAAGGTLSSVREDDGRLLFVLSGMPEGFEEQHRSGSLCVPTRDAEFWVKYCVGQIRSQVRLRERAQANRHALAVGELNGHKKK